MRAFWEQKSQHDLHLAAAPRALHASTKLAQLPEQEQADTYLGTTEGESSPSSSPSSCLELLEEPPSLDIEPAAKEAPMEAPVRTRRRTRTLSHDALPGTDAMETNPTTGSSRLASSVHVTCTCCGEGLCMKIRAPEGRTDITDDLLMRLSCPHCKARLSIKLRPRALRI